MLLVGLTGGIGCGKSTVADVFSDFGVPIIDADQIARQLVMPDQPLYAKVVAAFGAQVIDSDGGINRSFLRKVIFSNPTQRKSLEALLHPAIREEMTAQVKKIDAPYSILCIPLLVESSQMDIVNRVLVVDAPTKIQYRRIMERDHLDTKEIDDIMKAQATSKQRLAIADDVIVNNSSLTDLNKQVNNLHSKYLALAKN